MTKASALVPAIALIAQVTTAAAIQAPDTVAVRNGNLRLTALVWRPDGRGPFPAVLFNHGSWPTNNPLVRPAQEIFAQASVLGPVFARHGYVFLFLFRRGAGLSADQGVSTADQLQRELEAHGPEARNPVVTGKQGFHFLAHAIIVSALLADKFGPLRWIKLQGTANGGNRGSSLVGGCNARKPSSADRCLRRFHRKTQSKLATEVFHHSSPIRARIRGAMS